ncbi:unnamed protein product [Auanema sp. JU1783]|nr:unnamed protein product [Auanema sp. JU1783]
MFFQKIFGALSVWRWMAGRIFSQKKLKNQVFGEARASGGGRQESAGSSRQNAVQVRGPVKWDGKKPDREQLPGASALWSRRMIGYSVPHIQVRRGGS